MAVPACFRDFLDKRGVAYTVVTHPTAYTAQHEAAVTHIPGRFWAKTVVCFADDEPIMAVLPAPSSVDFERLRVLAGAATIRLAQEREMAALYKDCEAGAMPPLGPLYGQRVFVDAELTKDPEVVFNAGTHADAIRMRYSDLAALVNPVVGEFGRPPKAPAK
jgi:Ala-tRNA(Pro) deacylase